MRVRAIAITASAGAVAILAAALFLVSAVAADAGTAGNAASQQMPMASDQADMPADCPMWNESGSADTAGMYQQCQSYMSESGMGHMMDMMSMMSNDGMCSMRGGTGTMAGAAGEETSCPVSGAEPSGDRTGMGVCHQTEAES